MTLFLNIDCEKIVNIGGTTILNVGKKAGG